MPSSSLGVVLLALALVAGPQGALAITGGTTTDIALHPYQVAIDWVTMYDDDGQTYDYSAALLCGGALLTQSTVITAASCFASKGGAISLDNTKVRVGSQFREEGGENYGVVGSLVHPKYESFNSAYDLMLLYLDGEAPLRSEVQTVPLVGPGAGPAAGETLFVTGYGDLSEATKEQAGQLQLQAAALPAYNVDVCRNAYNLYYDGASRVCAGGAGVDLCGSRDVGSPVVDWLGRLVGVASAQMSRTCGSPGLPALFTSLADADIDRWIRDNAEHASNEDKGKKGSASQ